MLLYYLARIGPSETRCTADDCPCHAPCRAARCASTPYARFT